MSRRTTTGRASRRKLSVPWVPGSAKYVVIGITACCKLRCVGFTNDYSIGLFDTLDDYVILIRDMVSEQRGAKGSTNSRSRSYIFNTDWYAGQWTNLFSFRYTFIYIFRLV